MGWRQVLVLYGIAAVLAADYLRVFAPPEPESPAAVRSRVLAIDLGQLSEIAIDHGGRRVVARRDGSGWAIEEPAGAFVPSDLVQAFAVAVVDAEKIETLDEKDLTQFGLDDRATRVELRPSGGPPETLWIGGPNPSGTAVYARRLGTPGVVLVGRTLRYYEELILQALPRPAVPVDTPSGPVGFGEPLTSRGRPV
jgi:hypothetical protein